MKHIFIINPIAGKGKGIEFKEKIEGIFKDLDLEYEIIITEESGYATRKVKELTSKEKCRVYSIGGDGTLNEVLNGMVGSDSQLAVIPAGSGNDFARTLYKDISFDNILQELIYGEEKTIDVAKLNERYYLNISSVGFDANVVNNARKYKKYKFISGPMAYAIGLINSLITFKSMKLKFEVDGKEINTEMYLIAVANGKCYGGGISIAPNAEIEDGFLDVYAIRKPKVHRLIRFLPKVIKGKDIRDIDEVTYIKCKNISVKANEDITANIDGEIVFLNDMSFEIVPKAIKIIVPKKEIKEV